MNSKFTAIVVSIAFASSISLCACHDTNKFDRDNDPKVSSVSNYQALGIPNAPSPDNIEKKLQSPQGLKISKVGEQWFWRNSYSTSQYGGTGQDTITVNIPVGEANDKFATVRFDCDDLSTLIITDVSTENDAYMTFGDGINYAYIIHIPSDSKDNNEH